MRTIKFRGKPVDDNAGGFVYGSLLKGFFYETKTREEIVYIASPDFYPEYDSFEDMERLAVRVYPETVGQYTGLKDIEQFDEPKDLYVGDVVRMHQFLFDGNEYESEIIGVLEYDEEVAAICLTKINHKGIQKHMGYENDQEGFGQEKVPICMFYGLHETSWTYLGNIYEHPHLLEQPNAN